MIALSGVDYGDSSLVPAVTRDLLVMSEDQPSDAWAHVCSNFWPGWRRWYETNGGMNSSSNDARRAVRRYMPEMQSLVERLAEIAPHDVMLHSFLTFWCPPRYLTNCSQVVSRDGNGPFMIRNYDLDPALNELTVLRTRWRGKQVIGMVDGLCGLSDGINENGLSVSLCFGGRLVVGRGFGAPAIVRYLLEVCTDIQDAIEVLRLLPSHMSYNLSLTDRSGDAITVFLAPDRPPMFQNQEWATNHQLGVELAGHGQFSATLERAELIQDVMSGESPDAETLKHLFLNAPIFSTQYSRGFGTVFTSLYRPDASSLELLFCNGSAGCWSVHDKPQSRMSLRYDHKGSHFSKEPH